MRIFTAAAAVIVVACRTAEERAALESFRAAKSNVVSAVSEAVQAIARQDSIGLAKLLTDNAIAGGLARSGNDP